MKDSIASIALAKIVYVICLVSGEITVKGFVMVIFFGIISGACGWIGKVMISSFVKCAFMKSFIGYVKALIGK